MAAAAYGDGRRVPWALLSPEGTYYKLREPSFFVGRNGDVDLTLEVRFMNIFPFKRIIITLNASESFAAGFSTLRIQRHVINVRLSRKLQI